MPHSLFEELQSGFRKHPSTETALVKVISTLVLLDFSAACDTINHHIFLQRMEHQIVIKESVLRWFEPYLSDRYNFVHVKDESSSYDKVTHGVLQVSLLFITMKTCLKGIQIWTSYNFLILHCDKTEVIVLSPRHIRD